MFVELSRREEKIIKTLVEFTFDINGEEVKREVEVSHFNPKDEAEIERSINNRFISEERSVRAELAEKELLEPTE